MTNAELCIRVRELMTELGVDVVVSSSWGEQADGQWWIKISPGFRDPVFEVPMAGPPAD
jgi:hypothetical protein